MNIFDTEALPDEDYIEDDSYEDEEENEEYKPEELGVDFHEPTYQHKKPSAIKVPVLGELNQSGKQIRIKELTPKMKSKGINSLLITKKNGIQILFC